MPMETATPAEDAGSPGSKQLWSDLQRDLANAKRLKDLGYLDSEELSQMKKKAIERFESGASARAKLRLDETAHSNTRRNIPADEQDSDGDSYCAWRTGDLTTPQSKSRGTGKSKSKGKSPSHTAKRRKEEHTSTVPART